MKERDKITRGLRADETRAHKRFRWAPETFEKLRNGVDPATILDPDTKCRIKPDASTAVQELEPAAAESPPPTTPTSSEARTESPQRPLPKACPEDDAEMHLIVGETIGEFFQPPGTAQPPTDDPVRFAAAKGRGPGSDATRVAEEKVRRKQAAAAVAPGGDNGIGAPQAHADDMVDEVMKEKPKPCSCASAEGEA